LAQSHRELIRTGLERIRDKDVEGLLEILDPEVEWRSPPQGTLEDVYQGHEGVRKLFEHLFDAWDTIDHEPTKLVEVGDEAVTVTHVRAKAKFSGVEIDELWAYVSHARDGKLDRVSMYTDPEQALRTHTSELLESAPGWPED
jgi:ketosteroid isomerase-like protein